MSNKEKDFTVTFRCNEAVYRALVLMLRHAEMLRCGMSRSIGIYFDGDGRDELKILSLSEHIPSSPKGKLKNGDFYLDTDEVFNEV